MLEIINGVGKAIYDLRSAIVLPVPRPRIAFLPKYEGVLQIPDTILSVDDPFDVVEAEMRALGFALHREHRHGAVFTRGHSWGDFSAKLAPTEVHLGMPLQPEVSLRVEYSAFPAFDTGDLWQLATDIAVRIGALAELPPSSEDRGGLPPGEDQQKSSDDHDSSA